MSQLYPEIKQTAHIKIDNLSMSRGGTALFSGISVSIDTGQILWIHGGNGIGKTTLLDGLCGLRKPDTGEVVWQHNGVPCLASDIIAYQPHSSFAKAEMSAAEDLTFWGKIYGGMDLITATLDYVGLVQKTSVPCGRLSAGQRRRLALAKLIISQKPIWVMDEPTAAIDASGSEMFDALIRAHISRGGTAIIASHAQAQSLGPSTRKLTLLSLIHI